MSGTNGTRPGQPAIDRAEFAGMAALVTGGSLGIGRAAAHRLAQGGCAVMLCGRRQEHVDRAVGAFTREGLAVAGIAADVGTADGARRAVAAAVTHGGGLDIIVNAAGIQRYGTVVETDEATWDEVFAANVKSMYLTAHHGIPHLIARGGGAVINVSSVQGVACQTGVAAYAASKGAINALTRAIALDHAAVGVRAVAVLPGSVDTPMLRDSAALFGGSAAVDATVGAWGQMHPVGRVGEAAEVAELIAFLAGPRATFITGAEYRIDGALLAGIGVTLPAEPPQIPDGEGPAR